uniref:P-type domain-containing protein n=1 Tax=Branchiostoma floridae TaxID=7739 RepID=C3XPD0_BRAFL|eukprot:XP_002613792.1 hypothetical protein BRAFLDRAFT_85333 [Branchiostoma floridae]
MQTTHEEAVQEIQRQYQNTVECEMLPTDCIEPYAEVPVSPNSDQVGNGDGLPGQEKAITSPLYMDTTVGAAGQHANQRATRKNSKLMSRLYGDTEDKRESPHQQARKTSADETGPDGNTVASKLYIHGDKTDQKESAQQAGSEDVQDKYQEEPNTLLDSAPKASESDICKPISSEQNPTGHSDEVGHTGPSSSKQYQARGRGAECYAASNSNSDPDKQVYDNAESSVGQDGNKDDPEDAGRRATSRSCLVRAILIAVMITALFGVGACLAANFIVIPDNKADVYPVSQTTAYATSSAAESFPVTDISRPSEMTTVLWDVTPVLSGVKDMLPHVTTPKPDVTALPPALTTVHVQSAVTSRLSCVTTVSWQFTTAQPDVTTVKPDVATVQLDVTTSLPHMTAVQPGVATSLPDVTTTLTHVTAVQPDVTTTLPHVTTLQPDAHVTTSLPEMTTEHVKPFIHHTTEMKLSKMEAITRQEITAAMKETACEDHTLRLSCPPGQSLVIDDANYGRTSRSVCPCTGDCGKTYCRAAKSLSIVWSNCQGLEQCNLESNRLFGDPCSGVQVTYRCSTACSKPFGMMSGAIPDDSITASSHMGPDHEPYRGRLNGEAGAAWTAKTNNVGEWMQVFPGNADTNTPVTNLLDYPIDARFVRFVVQSWQGSISMRAEVLGCSEICSVDDPIFTYDKYRWGLPRLTRPPFMFEVKAERDVHVALSSRQDQDLDEIYEIVIGGWDNMRSVIRRSRQGYNHVDVQTPNIVSKTEYRTFWIMWSSDGTIAVGRGDENLPFMLWRDPDPLPINYAGLKSDWRNVDRKVGQWKLCRTARPDDAECLVEPAMRHECGWAGITSDQCRSKGCCYNTATTRPEIPWCFHRAKKGTGPRTSTAE